MSEDNLVSRVLQQSHELVERKLKACEIYRDSTKPLSDDCYIKEPICEVDPELSRFVKEHCALQEKLEIAVKALEKYADEFNWCDSKVKLGIDGFGIKSKEVSLPKSCYHDYGFEEAQEALEKIKRIK